MRTFSSSEPKVWIWNDADVDFDDAYGSGYVMLLIEHEGRYYGVFPNGACCDEERVQTELETMKTSPDEWLRIA